MPAAPAVTRSEKIAIKKHRTGLQNGCRQAAAAGEREGNKNAPRGSWRGRKRGHIMKKRLLSILLTACLLVGLLPTVALAVSGSVNYLNDQGVETTYTGE